MQTNKMSKTWQDLVDSVSLKSLKKSESTSFLKRYSFEVPDLVIRNNILNNFIKNLDSYDGTQCRRSGQYLIGVIISTTTTAEIKELAPTLKLAIEHIYSHYTDKEFLFLDYVLSKDWGKFVEILQHDGAKNTNNIKQVLNSNYFDRSDEFACLMLKLYSSGYGRKLLQLLNVNRLDAKNLFGLFERIKGKSGGLIREVYFSVRREPVFIADEHEAESELVLYLQVADLSDFTAFSTVMISLRALHYDIYKLFNELNKAQPKVAEMMLATVGLPYLVWDKMQFSLLRNELCKNDTTAISAKNLKEFYENLLKGYSKDISNKYSSESKVGVIITTFKPNIELLKCSLISIIKQTHKKLSICVIDDCNSEDISNEIRQVVKELNDDRIILEKNKNNVGQYISRNIAMKRMSDCEYFAIQDDDDVSHAQRIEYQMHELIEQDGQLCMCQQVRFDNEMRYIADKINPFEFDFSPASSMFRADLISEVGEFANVRSRGDVEFITRIKKSKGIDIIKNLALPFYIMRCDLNTVSASKDKYLKTQLDVFRTMMSSDSLDSYLDGQQHALFS
ncbi:glycosyltransferase family 2 protein [Psychrobacter sp.]|uniref:glycosyltransferase family 2 protein n=1 Tax=Psychrobacter sp. TaxID=56811 RepID=UPI003F95E635